MESHQAVILLQETSLTPHHLLIKSGFLTLWCMAVIYTAGRLQRLLGWIRLLTGAHQSLNRCLWGRVGGGLFWCLCLINEMQNSRMCSWAIKIKLFLTGKWETAVAGADVMPPESKSYWTGACGWWKYFQYYRTGIIFCDKSPGI